MLDPEWTHEKGYSHAQGLLDILAKHDKEVAEQETKITEEEDLSA